jgi:hypothetical protein
MAFDASIFIYLLQIKTSHPHKVFFFYIEEIDKRNVPKLTLWVEVRRFELRSLQLSMNVNQNIVAVAGLEPASFGI